MANRTVTLDEIDIAILLDAALVQMRTLEAYRGLLHVTMTEIDLYVLQIANLRRARESLMEQVMS